MFRKVFSAIVSCALALVIGCQIPLNAFADSIPQYVKEVRMATASSRSEAVASLEKDGYKAIDFNLHEGSGGKVCYMGYKTTTDRDEAITDIRLMNAGGGYKEKKYRDLVAEWKTGISSSAAYLKEASLETAENYRKGSPLAAAAVEILDLFEVDGVKLSTYLFDSSREDTDYQDILLICADDVVSAIYSALCLGSADYGKSSFAERLAGVDPDGFEYKLIESMDDSEDFSSYWDSTSRVIEQLQEFGTDYDDAVMFFADYEEDAEEPEEECEEPTEEQYEEYWKKFIDEKYKNSEDEEEQELYRHAYTIGLYDKLSGYASFDEEKYENLAEYIYTCGDPFDEDGEESDNIYYRIYPLVSVLTPGQIFTLQYGGVGALVSALDSNTEKYRNEASSAVSELKSKISENGLERISVFYNVNREIYDETVAFTTEAERIAVSSSSYSELTKEEGRDKLTRNLTNVVLISGMVAASLLAVTVLTLGITAAIVGTTSMTLLTAGFTAIIAGSVAIASGGLTLTTGAIVAGIIGAATVIVAIVIVAVIIICVIIAIIKRIISDSKQKPTVYSDAPNLIYDVVGPNFTQYRAVTGTDGKPADINCGDSGQWDTVYVSYSSKAGKPVTASGTDSFICSSDSAVPPEGYTALRRFGYTDTANLNAYDKSSKALYFFYTTSDSYNDDGENESGTEYLFDIQLAIEDSKEAARLALVNKGYTAVEQNLTPCSDKVSYIGYKTTTRESDAITDIRIAYYCSNSKFVYGNTPSGAPAEYALVGELNTKASIYYTKQQSNGSPILADLKVTDTLLDADEGYEPVNMFSGGNAFNLTIGSNDANGLRVMKSGNWNKPVYLYFRPSMAFGSGTPEYVSGFAFSSGAKNNLDFAAQNGFGLVESLGQYNLTDGLTENATYLLYSTTHNPFRAITEIKTYNASVSAESLFENIGFGTTGYVACETFACVKNEKVFTTDYVRMLRPSNGFVTRIEYEGAVDTSTDSDFDAVNDLGKYALVPLKGLYVAGPCQGKAPLTVDDIYFCKDKNAVSMTEFTNSKGEKVPCKPVTDLTECYSDKADNLTFEWACSVYNHGSAPITLPDEITFRNQLRIFYRGEPAKRGKYVSGITVATFDSDKKEEKGYSYDQAMAKLLSQGEGEILKINFKKSSADQPVTTETVNGSVIDVKKKYSGPATYIMVRYTDYRMDAVRAVTSRWFDDAADLTSGKINEKLPYQGVKFDPSGDAVFGLSGRYAIYTSKNGQLGSAITDVVVDSEYFINGCTTISDCEGGYHLEEDYILKFRHAANEGETFINMIYASYSNSKQNALIDLYKHGCTEFIDQNKNEGLGNSYLYFGYATTVNGKDPSIIKEISIVSKTSTTGKSGFSISGILAQRNYTDNQGRLFLLVPCLNNTNNLNYNVGGKETYLYTSTSGDSPIIKLSTTAIMSSDQEKIAEYSSSIWTTTTNVADGTSGNYTLCYKKSSADWEITNDGELIVKSDSHMDEYTDDRLVNYSVPGGKAVLETVSVLPEWCEYGDSINRIKVLGSVNKINGFVFRNCPNVESVTILNRQCDIGYGAIPKGIIIKGYESSTAYDYAMSNGNRFEITTNLGGTIMGETNIPVAVGISASLTVCGVVALILKKRKKFNAESEGDSNE